MFYVLTFPLLLFHGNQTFLGAVFEFAIGDLFVDGKVIPRPQYRFNERQQTRNRPRPRYDRRRETMQVERREPIRRETWSPNQQAAPQQPTPMNGQNVPQGGEGGYQPNQGGFQGKNA